MRAIKKAATDQSVVIRIVDSTDGTPETGVVYNTAGIDLWYRREGAVKTSITEATLADASAAHSDGGVVHIGDGYYRLDPPDAAFATGVNGVMFGGTVTGMVVIGCYVPLVAYDPQDADGLGLSRVDAAVTTRLAPTVAGRTLDVTATGAGGIDLGNAENQGSTLALSATTIKTATDVETDTADIQSRLPAALVGGRMDSYMGAIADGVFTAAKFAAGALDAVWSVGTRILTAGTNIALAKGVGVTGFNDLSAAQVNAEADQALADAGVTTTRTAFLDKLNVTGLVASAADIAAITQAQRVRIVVPAILERPDSGSTVFRIWIYSYSEQHTAEALDGVPTVAAENNAGTDRSANLSAVSNPATGVYYVDYTVAAAHAIEGLVFKVTATEGAVATEYAASTSVLDVDQATSIATILAKVNTLHDTRIPGTVEPQSGDAFARIGAAGAGLTAVPWNAAWDAEVESEVTDALEARGYTAIVSGRIDAAISTRLASASYTAPPSAASIRAEIDLNSVGLQAIYARTDVATSTRLASASYTAPLDSTATQAAAAAALTAYDPPTRAEATSDKDAVIAALPAAPDNASILAIKLKTDGLPSDPADASVIAGRFDAVDAAVAAVKVDTEAVLVDSAAIKVVTDRLSAMLELDGDVYRFTINALEQGASAGGVTEENITDIVDAVFAQAIEVGGPTFLQVQRVMAAMLTGVCSGANASTTLFKAIGSTTKVRVTMATDTDTNRVSVTLDYTD